MGIFDGLYLICDLCRALRKYRSRRMWFLENSAREIPPRTDELFSQNKQDFIAKSTRYHDEGRMWVMRDWLSEILSRTDELLSQSKQDFIAKSPLYHGEGRMLIRIYLGDQASITVPVLALAKPDVPLLHFRHFGALSASSAEEATIRQEDQSIHISVVVPSTWATDRRRHFQNELHNAVAAVCVRFGVKPPSPQSVPEEEATLWIHKFSHRTHEPLFVSSFPEKDEPANFLDVRLGAAKAKPAAVVILPAEETSGDISPTANADTDAHQNWDPHRAGEQLIAKLTAAEGGSYSLTELMERWQHTPQSLYNWRHRKQVVFWQDAKGEFHYPKWQFHPNGRVQRPVQDILRSLDSHDSWRILGYFLQPKVGLGGKSPLELIGMGEHERVLEHARIAGEQGTW